MSLVHGTVQAATFFTIVGSQDPQVAPGQEQGPALDLLDALIDSGEKVSEVILAWTPGAANRAWPGGYDEQLKAVQQAAVGRLPDVKVRTVELRVRPNAAAELLPVLAQALARFRYGGRLLVNTSSGTPQMLEALKVLRGTGWFSGGDVRLLQVDRPEYRQEGQPFWREATTPFLEETLRMQAAFDAMRRYDYAGARDAFTALGDGPLELQDRKKTVNALAVIAEALWLLDTCNVPEAADVLDSLTTPVPPMTDLVEFVSEARRFPAEALIWLTWARYDRAAAQDRMADALVWAVVLHELLVVKLAEQLGLPDTDQPLQVHDLPQGLFATLKAQVDPECVDRRGRLKFRTLAEKLALLHTPALKSPAVDLFDAKRHKQLETVRRWRSVTLHQGRIPEEVDLNEVENVVKTLLLAYPFQSDWGREWAQRPHRATVAADTLTPLVDHLQEWAG